MTERHRSLDELALIEQMRELRESERAPDAFRSRLSARLLEAVDRAASARDSLQTEASERLPLGSLAPHGRRYFSGLWARLASRFAPGSRSAFAAWPAPIDIALLGIGAAAGHLATRWVEGGSKMTVAVEREPTPRSLLVSPLQVASPAGVAGERIPDPARGGDISGNISGHGPPNDRRDVKARARPELAVPPLAPANAAPSPALMTQLIPIPHWQLNTVALARGDAVVARGRNLVTNGDFAKGDALWSVRVWNDFEEFPATIAPHRFVDGALCVTLLPGEHRIGGWPFGKTDLMPHSFALAEARPYRLSLRAWISGPLAMQLAVKIGEQTSPHTQTIAALVPVTTERQSFTVDFTAPHSEPNGGVAWLASAAAHGGPGELCVDDISVTMR